LPLFNGLFESADGRSRYWRIVSLTCRQIEDAAVQEILQTPGVALGTWKFLDTLLDPKNRFFVFREALGQSREVKTAVSGLFGRFVARAFATHELDFNWFAHVRRPPMRLSGAIDGVLIKRPGTQGDMPDWVAGDTRSGKVAIIEAKGCHDAKIPPPALKRAIEQAKRAVIRIDGHRVPVKRYAIATRWGIARSKLRDPILCIKDPDERGKTTRAEMNDLMLGIIRRHIGSLLDPLGYAELSNQLIAATAARTRRDSERTLTRAQTVLEQLPVRRLVGAPEGQGPQDALIGGFVSRFGPMDVAELSESDLSVLSRLRLRPTFVGIEKRVVRAAISGDTGQITTIQEHWKETKPSRYTSGPIPFDDVEKVESLRLEQEETPEPDDPKPQNSAPGTWLIRLDEDNLKTELSDK
jgi:hypothetical protein